MSSKVLLRIALVLGIALAAWALLALLHRASADAPVAFALPRITAEAAETIDYIGPQDTIRLARQGALWTVNGHPAAPKVVEAFFRALADTTTRSELIAQSAESHRRLGVDSVGGKHLTVTGGGKDLLDLWFGNRGPDFEGFYVRRAGDTRVFLLRGTFADLTVQPLEDWRDKQIAALRADSVTAIEVARGKTSYVLQRTGGGWVFARGGAADSARVGRFLARFQELRATGFPTPGEADSARFTPADRQVTLRGAGGQALATLVLDSMTTRFVLRAREGGELYAVDQPTADLITPEESSFRK